MRKPEKLEAKRIVYRPSLDQVRKSMVNLAGLFVEQGSYIDQRLTLTPPATSAPATGPMRNDMTSRRSPSQA